VRTRIEKLRARIPPTPTPSPTPPTPTPPPVAASPTRPADASRPSAARAYLAPIVVGSGALVAAIVGAGLLGSVRRDFDDADGPNGCRPCTDEQIAPLERRAYAGYAMLGIAGALAVVDIALFATTARRRAASRVAALSILGGRNVR
jgi:hypothetical protein